MSFPFLRYLDSRFSLIIGSDECALTPRASPHSPLLQSSLRGRSGKITCQLYRDRRFGLEGQSRSRVRKSFGFILGGSNSFDHRQGCTKATVGVATLSGLLDKLSPSCRSLPSTFSTSFWSLQHARIGGLWDQTKAEDYAWETTTPVEGETLDDGKLTRWYTRNLIAVGRTNALVANVIYGSAMFLAPGTDALHPAVVSRVLWAGLKVCLPRCFLSRTRG